MRDGWVGGGILWSCCKKGRVIVGDWGWMEGKDWEVMGLGGWISLCGLKFCEFENAVWVG